jgi:hypothetical protein
MNKYAVLSFLDFYSFWVVTILLVEAISINHTLFFFVFFSTSSVKEEY